MTRLQARFRKIVSRFGSDLGGSPAVMALLTPLRARTYVTDADVDAASKPMWIAYTGFDHPAAEDDTLAYGARSLKVKRAIDIRFTGATVARILILFSAPGSPISDVPVAEG